MDDIKERSKLRGLYVQRDQLLKKIEISKKEKKKVSDILDELYKKLDGIKNGIDQIENGSIIITRHFIERFKERVNFTGTDIETRAEIHDKVLTFDLLHQIDLLGSGHYPVMDGKYVVIVEDNKLLTIFTPEEKEEKKQRLKLKRKKYGTERYTNYIK